MKIIRETREEIGMSFSDLAKKSGIDESRLSKMETGKANPTVAMLERIAKALGKKLRIGFE